MPDLPHSLKDSCRREVFAALRAQPSKTRAAASASIRDHLAASPGWAPGGTILLFAALPNEPDLVPLIEHTPIGARLLFPSVVDVASGKMVFHHVTDRDQLAPRSSRIPEPDPDVCPAVSPNEVTAALVPGVAFDPSTGARLGRGGGFYDRLLGAPEFTALTTGVCFALQQRSLTVEPHDCPVGAIITEEGRFALPRTAEHGFA